MKIGILTFHASHNYGSMLQAYALQTYLTEKGHNVYIINLRIWAQKNRYPHPLLTFKKSSLRYIIKPHLLLQDISKYNKFERFMRESYRLTPEFHKLKEVDNYVRENKFDALISGGDQIWNMNADDFTIAYYLPFDISGLRKIAYSASFGSGETFVPEHYQNSIKKLLEVYDSLCTRDEAGSELLTKLFGRLIPSMTDPTMLLTKSVYEKLAGEKSIVSGKYIFYYSPINRPEFASLALNFAKTKGLPIYTSNGKPNHCKGMRRIQNAGPKEFLNLLMHADVVCGKSFHLVVFSLIMEKQFLSITGNSDARISGILDKFGLMDHGIAADASLDDFELSDIDWVHVRNVLSQYRAKGEEYLNEALI